MEGQFKKVVNEMFLNDKEYLQNIDNRGYFCFEKIDTEDRLEEYYHHELFRSDERSNLEKIELFNTLLRVLLRLGLRECPGFICDIVGLSFTTPKCYGFIYRCESIISRSVIRDLTKATYSPLSLKHIAAAKSISSLKLYKSEILIGIYNATKNQDLFIRVGEKISRKTYKFSNIVKHFIYKQSYEPLVAPEYFEILNLKPTPFCIHCGLRRKIEQNWCWCPLCNLLREAIAHTSIVEKPFHTIYQQ